MASPQHTPNESQKWPDQSQEESMAPETYSLGGSTTSEDSNDHVEALAEELSRRISRLSDPATLTRRVTSVGTTGTTDPNYEVDYESEDDPDNPKNWTVKYKAMAMTFLSWNTLMVVLYSTSYTSGIADIAADFQSSNTIVTLGLTFYLIGLAAGSMLMAPLSEVYGRKPVSVSVETLIIVRFFGALFGSVMISTAPGMVSDLVTDEQRALAMSIWSIGPVNGPVVGPIIGGFVTQYLGWRWMNWIAMMFSAVSVVFALLMKETYSPIILQKKAARLRKETDEPRWWSRYDQKTSLGEMLKVNLGRPFVMAVTEPICIFWNIYIAIVYGILYLCFTAYPIVFRDIRGWSLGLSGLAFLGIGVGSLIMIACEPLIRRMINNHKKDPETGKPPPEAMVSIVCIAAVLVPAGELWFAWTCAPASIHWIAPILAGVLFGAGNTGVFIYASNYLAYSYGVYAASAMAGNSVVRSVLGGVLPLVGTYLYAGIGPNWSGTLLGLLEVIIIPIPVVFYKYGYKIREKSTLISQMQEDKRRLEGKRKRLLQRLEANANANAEAEAEKEKMEV
ncbi:hypothetical protein FE257_001167 [Aspergillus nanangensis]|uniref:Major facilitator superfamily (MFS) profile domain-containing protein n=1 Tax=Aspergillus nanangensis TaxID=2582783 RepID=A0AAD4GXI8_ASPNN|nr:hypothetical protein FE257_001167 [Aspergillus nanangensis]